MAVVLAQGLDKRADPRSASTRPSTSAQLSRSDSRHFQLWTKPSLLPQKHTLEGSQKIASFLAPTHGHLHLLLYIMGQQLDHLRFLDQLRWKRLRPSQIHLGLEIPCQN